MSEPMAGDGKAALFRVVFDPLRDAAYGDRRTRERALLDEEHLSRFRRPSLRISFQGSVGVVAHIDDPVLGSLATKICFFRYSTASTVRRATSSTRRPHRSMRRNMALSLAFMMM